MSEQTVLTPEQPTSIHNAIEVVRALAAAGVNYVVHCPGSRCAPFAYALEAAAAAGWMQVDVHIDERGGAFAALGYTLASGRPAAIITTSGTAVANLHPALLEAAHSRLPLIAITADRPEHLIGSGANQTTFQTGIFSPLVPTVTIGCGSRLSPRQARLFVRRALGAATAAEGTSQLFANGFRPTAPGHINIHFDDPLYPATKVDIATPETDKLFHYDSPKSPAKTLDTAPHSAKLTATKPPTTEAIPLQSLPPLTVVIAGDKANRDVPDLAQLCARANIPLLAEPSSGVRCGNAAICAYRTRAELKLVTDVFVVGRPTLSRPINALLERAEVTVVVGAHGIPDVTLNANHFVTPTQLQTILTEAAKDTDARASWLASWKHAPMPTLSAREKAASLIWEQQAPGMSLVIGASSTIRDFDLAAKPAATCAPVYANRGLAGIDGTIATAYGVARASGLPTRAVIGDISFLHDISSLALLQPDENNLIPLQVVVMNDGGGSIFRNLEHAHAASATGFTKFFLTPRNVNLAAVAVGYGWEYNAVESLDELDYLLRRPIREPGIVEFFMAN